MNQKMQLRVDDFAGFFEELWGHAPFPWQIRLLETVVEQGWPTVLDLPTGTGKTAVLEIACFALALDAHRPISERQQARRVALVIDRRIVVDQAYERACSICSKLQAAKSGVIARVASSLMSLHSGLGSDMPMIAASLRGGTVRDNNWCRSPDQPCFLISTVDQVGSRLLFRGYGVSEGMAPVHAGILGVDCVYFLDEIHLSRPFFQSLNRLCEYAKSPLVEEKSLRVPRIVSMSATPGKAESAFRLASVDFENSTLSRRLNSKKLATLVKPVKISARRDVSNQRIAKACSVQAKSFVEKGAHAIAIIVNRVDTARCAAQLAQKLADEVVLLTGRMRSLDRDDVQRSVMDDLRAGRERSASKTTIVVSTQAIEVGADFDFDAIVTECASLDALRQRFGRLDRRGELQGSAQAAIVVGDRQITKDHEDPIYGKAIAATWAWLSEQAQEGVIDMSITAQRSRDPFPDDVLVSEKRAPELLPAYLDLWAQTSPKPAVEPDVPIFLHGAQKGAPQVQVLWRADICDNLLRIASGEDGASQSEAANLALDELFEVCPPSALETVALPLWAAKSWLARTDPAGDVPELAEVSDVEGAEDPASLLEKKSGSASDTPCEEACAPFVVFDSGMMRVTSDVEGIAPGSIVVLPSTRGGLSARTKNWDPNCLEPVQDLGDRAQLVQRGRAIVRWATLNPQQIKELYASVDADAYEFGGEAVLSSAFSDWAEGAFGGDEPGAWLSVASNWIASSPKSRVLEIERPDISATVDPDSGSTESGERATPWRVSVRYNRVPGDLMRLASGPQASTASLPGAEDRASFTNRRIPLLDHLNGVQEYAAAFARRAGLSQDLVNDLELAGLLHDLGKSDPRFQAMLLGGDPVDALQCDELLAKSNLPFFDLSQRRRAQMLARYPKGARHEVMSVALVEGNSKFKALAKDWDLVLHLVASHHGHCRPFAPVLYDDEPVDVELTFQGETLRSSSNNGLDRLDGGISRRFWDMVRRYGWHGLAYLEAILRLADHRRSEFEQQESTN